MYNSNRFEDRVNDHRAFDDREGFDRHGMGQRHREPFGPDMNDPERGFHNPPRDALRRSMGPNREMAPDHGMAPDRTMLPGASGRPPHGGHGFQRGMPGGPGFGMPPRRPSREFLQRRVEEADLAELIDMAGRMLRRRPQGGPAQGQALILSILAGREVLSQRELQQMLGIQPGSLSELVSKLEAKGMLAREKAEDRRGNLLRITNAGRQALAAAQPEDAPYDDPFAPLTAEQQDQLSAMLRALLNRWISQLDDPPRGPRGQKPVEV